MSDQISPEELSSRNSELLDEIIRMSDFSFERLPMLDIIGERLADSLALALPNMTGTLCEAELTQLDYLPMSQINDALSDPVLLAVCSSHQLYGPILLVLDSPLVLTALELMLGGTPRGATPHNTEGFTAIERGFGKRLAGLIAQELQRNMALVGDIELDLDRIETDPDAASVTQPANLCVRMQIALAQAGHSGALEVILPYDALEPLRPKLGRIHFGGPGEDASPWREQLASQIERATVELEAVLTDIRLPIQDIMGWAPGDTVNLWIEEDHEATVLCAETAMFRAALGKRNNGNTAIRITETLTPEEETSHGCNDH
ncbi:flagellar motor switch protein FliM [Pseudodonghicola xiamenensis]|uniref:Flagellar motor switch protein FliM n=1 Tax=Pseudodonghicola xiamenensis TaxID=337702 RepID=A0A8J3MCD3_9RHOB|nr:FliM/FliN family flagellar motor switch protein [Pseudodonghicola xiamenensis]GHG85363.1 flagellar motor switch protein FliM [Pseudodonghicola xiamenensis]